MTKTPQLGKAIDGASVAASLRVHFARGLRGDDLQCRIRRDFEGLTKDEYDQGALIAWPGIVADAQIQIRRDTEEPSQYSIWFVLGDAASCEWQGEEHWEAAFQAGMIRERDYPGVAVVDQVTGETLL